MNRNTSILFLFRKEWNVLYVFIRAYKLFERKINKINMYDDVAKEKRGKRYKINMPLSR